MPADALSYRQHENVFREDVELRGASPEALSTELKASVEGKRDSEAVPLQRPQHGGLYRKSQS